MIPTRTKIQDRFPILRRQPLFAFGLVAVLAISYWIPLLWWVGQYGRHGLPTLPRDLPFGLLLRRTFFVSMIVASGAIVAAYPIALLWRLSPGWCRRLFAAVMAAPLLLGFIARNYSWIGMLGSDDPIISIGWSLVDGRHLLYTKFAVELVMTSAFVPVAFFLLVQGVAAVTQEHVDAARTLGAPDSRVLFHVLLPQSFRAAILAFGMVFSMSLGWFITPRLLGGGRFDFVSNWVLTLVNLGSFGDASNVAFFFLLATALPSVIVTFLAVKRRRFITGR